MSNQSSQERISQKLSANNGEKKSRKSSVLTVTILSILTVCGIVGLLLLFGNTSEADKRNVVVTPENVEETLAQMSEASKTQAGSYEVTMNTTWEFENGGSASSNAYVENSTANSNDVYFDLVRSDTGETIYSSPIIPVGSHLENIALDTALEAGNYDCVLTYHLLDEDEKPISKLNINVKIRVAN